MTEWYYQIMGGVFGPLSWEQLKERVRSGEIEHETEVAEGPDGPWIAASHVAGLFALLAGPAADVSPGPEVKPAVNVEPGAEEAAAGRGEEEVGVRRSPLNLRPCSDCGTMVSNQASMCPHCGRAFHESSLTARYRGEQPVVILALMSLVAIAFLFLTPPVVYGLAVRLAPNVIHAGKAQETASIGFGLVVVGLYVFGMLVCALLGGAVGKPRMAYLTGCFLGLLFGPLGVFTAFAIDKRPQCPQCSTRLNGMAKQCPGCHARLVWKVVPSWY